MKKIFIVFTSAAFTLAACNSGGSGDTKATAGEEVKTEEPAANPDYEKGLAIEAKQNCYTCHRIDEKLIGPSYTDIANKYAGTSDTIVAHLASKIISGGSGVWGDAIMIPHPELNIDDAEAIVKYIFTLKK